MNLGYIKRALAIKKAKEKALKKQAEKIVKEKIKQLILN